MARIAAALALLVACTPIAAADAPPWREAPQGRSVVTIIEPQGDGYSAPRWVAFCNAFAIDRGGVTLLATAEHCLHGRTAGSSISYQEPSGWGIAWARIVLADVPADRALLQPEDPIGLVPLRVAAPPLGRAHVWSESSYYHARSEGVVAGDLGLGWRDTSITIRKGWSGSPVFDMQGAAWGIVARCNLRWGTDQCRPGSAQATAIP